MLTRRHLLKTSVAFTALAAIGFDIAKAAPGKLIGHSVRCVSHMLDNHVSVEEIEVIYLSATVMAPQENDSIYKYRRDKFLGAITIDRWPHRSLSTNDIHRVDEWVANGVIRLRPTSMGLVGRKIWTRDGITYFPPRLYGAMLESVQASYERLA